MIELQTDKMLAEKAEGIGWMTFNNPARRNATSLEMWRAIADILDDFGADPAVRVVVMRGAGDKAFVSGADISQFESQRADAEAAARYNAVAEGARVAMAALEKPLIAMIRGYCLGGGLGLGAELFAAVGLGAVAAAGDHQRTRHFRIAQAEMEGREAAHGETHDMGPRDAQVVEHRLDVGGCAGLGVTARVVGHLRGRVAAGVGGDATIAAREVAHLRLPAAMVAGELVHEDHRLAAPGLLEVQLDPVVGLGESHVAPLSRFPLGAQVSRRTESMVGRLALHLRNLPVTGRRSGSDKGGHDPVRTNRGRS